MHPSIAQMTRLCTAQLLADFDAILDRVATGECFVITSEHGGGDVVLIPYDQYTTLLDQAGSTSSTTKNADAPSP